MNQVTDEQVKTALAANLKALLISRGWSGNRLAHECGEPQPTISRILNGQHVPKLGTITRIADALQTSVDYLLNRQPAEDGKMTASA